MAGGPAEVARRVGVTPVRAAGGIVWRPGETDGSIEVLIVHRQRYDDWSLPKGKALPDEDDATCALREVHEETGLRCSIARRLGTVEYRDRFDRPKSVVYFEMRAGAGRFEPHDEVDMIRWIPVAEAADALSYPHDRELVAAFEPSP
jgi:8-oxo-dGTP pyrophosphatase MutT (NUDIX family)